MAVSQSPYDSCISDPRLRDSNFQDTFPRTRAMQASRCNSKVPVQTSVQFAETTIADHGREWGLKRAPVCQKNGTSELHLLTTRMSLVACATLELTMHGVSCVRSQRTEPVLVIGHFERFAMLRQSAKSAASLFVRH